jgi:hypothetical protein
VDDDQDSASPVLGGPASNSTGQSDIDAPGAPFPADLGKVLGSSRFPRVLGRDDSQTMVTPADVEQAFETSISELAIELGKRRGPKAFSRNAVNELVIQQANFLQDMGLEAINTARRNQADVVSGADVRNAEVTLRSRGPSFPSRLLQPVGGLFAGAGLAQLYTVLSAPKDSPPSTLAYLIAAISTIVGIALLSFGLAKR